MIGNAVRDNQESHTDPNATKLAGGRFAPFPAMYSREHRCAMVSVACVICIR